MINHEQDLTQQESESLDHMSFSTLEKTVIFLCFLLIVGYFVSSFFPEERLWGINHLAYFPLYVRMIIVFLGLLFLISVLNSRIINFLKDKVNLPFFGWMRKHKYWGYVILSIVFLLAFWLLRTRTFLLGDGYLRVREISTGFEFKASEFLDLYLHSALYRLFHQIFNWDAYTVYALVSYVCGAFFIYFVLLLSDLIGRRGIDKLLIFFLLVFSGGSQLFFGYVESYTISYLGVFLFIYFSIGYLKGRNNLTLPFVSLILSIFFHASALYLFPSFLFLFLTKSPEQKHDDTRRISYRKFFIIILITLCAISGFYLLKYYPIGEVGEKLSFFLIPLTGTKENPYSLFSFSHLLDVLNQQLLISPVGIVIWVGILLCLRKRLNFRSASSQFFLLVTLFSFGFALLIDPVLGFARDWDLFASTGLGYTIWGGYIVIDFLKDSRKARHVFYAACVTILISSLPWFSINAEMGKSVRRFENLMGLYQRGKAYGHWTLCWFYYTQGKTEKEIEEVEKAMAIEEHPRYIIRLGQLYNQIGDSNRAHSLFKKAIQMDSENADFHSNLGLVYMKQGLFEEAESEFNRAIQIDPDEPDFHNHLGITYTNKGLFEKATFEFRKAIQLEPSNLIYLRNLGDVLSQRGLINEAIEQYEKAKGISPKDPFIHYRLGGSYTQKGFLDKAILFYRRSLELKPDYVEACYSLGSLLSNTNKTDEAILLLEKATEIKPDFATAHYALALALAKNNLKQEASEHLQIYLDLSKDTTENWKVRSLIEYLKSK